MQAKLIFATPRIVEWGKSWHSSHGQERNSRQEHKKDKERAKGKL